MKKAWLKLHRQELIYDFVIYGLIVFLGEGFLLYHIMKTTNKPVLYAEDIRLIGFSAAAIFVIILLSGIFLYKISASYIRWYKGILDSIPMPVIVTDKDASWQQINKAARKIMGLKQDNALENFNSRHLIGTDGDVMKKNWIHRGTEYKVTGNRLRYGSKGTGYLIFLNNTYQPNSCETRTELINEINRLLGRLSTATDQFHDCASTLAGCTVRQAGIITELSDVIAGIASGEFNEADTLNKKMYAVKSDMQQHVESSQANLKTVRQTCKELNATRDYIGGVLHDIDSIP